MDVDVVEVLVSLTRDDVGVGVVCDRDGRLWLSRSLERVAGARDRRAGEIDIAPAQH